MVKVGDIFEIRLEDERKAYGQFVFKDKKQGPLVQIFNLIANEGDNFTPDEIKKSGDRFPPVITGLQAAIRAGLWRVIGKLPIVEFSYPRFVSAYYDEKTGEAYRWFVWDGEKTIQIGKELPIEYKGLEYRVVWSPYDVTYRIESGEYPYPYGDLIKYNRFTPRDKKVKQAP